MPREWDAVPGKWHNDVEFSDDEGGGEDEEDTADGEPSLKWDSDHPLNGAVRGELAFYADLTGWPRGPAYHS